MNELNEILKSIPLEVKWNDVVDFEDMDNRISAIEALFINIIGVGNGFIEFCPDNDPPLKEEVLSWIWVFRPDLADELLKMELSKDFRMLVQSFKDQDIDRFWSHMSK